MKLLLACLAVLAASVLLTQAVMHDPGHLLVSYGGWTLETSLAVALLLALAAFGVLTVALRLSGRLWHAPRRLRAWEERRARRQAHRALLRGLLDLAEGDWSAAERNLVRRAAHSELPLLNFLSAARAAQQQEAYERRDRYLHLAHESMPAADVAVSLTQAELQLAHRQNEQALATLMYLRQVAPRHTYVLRLLRTLYERLADWRALLALLPELRRRGIGEAANLDALEQQAQLGLLLQVAGRGDPDALAAHWTALPKAVQRRGAMLDAYAGLLQEAGDDGSAEALLRSALENRWDPVLVQRYGRLSGADARLQLETAEAWLARHPREPALLLALGRFSLRNRLWGKARAYLEAAIGAGGPRRPAAYRELGGLLEQMGEPAAALDCYRKGLALSCGEPAPVPARVVPIAAGGRGGRVAESA
jgi:HemY protein